MKEYFTKALVLDIEDKGEYDKTICLYTEKLGKVYAKARSARKLLSKAAGHLQPLNFITLRLIEKIGIQTADALTYAKLPKTKKSLILAQFLKDMTCEFQSDDNLWITIENAVIELQNNTFSLKPILSNLGFADDFAECHTCKSQNISHFSKREQIFLCPSCAFATKITDLNDDLIDI